MITSFSVEVDLAGGLAQLRRLRQLYCPDGHESRLAPEAQRLADAVEAVLRLTLVPVGAGQQRHLTSVDHDLRLKADHSPRLDRGL
jgi:hypothetical protein